MTNCIICGNLSKKKICAYCKVILEVINDK